jgi:putative transposase
MWAIGVFPASGLARAGIRSHPAGSRAATLNVVSISRNTLNSSPSAALISYGVWLYFRFPLSLRMVEEMLAARGISVTYEAIRQWGLRFGREFANRIRRRAPYGGDKWHLDEVVITIAAKKHWLWRAVDREGFVLDVLVQSQRDKDQIANVSSRRPNQDTAAKLRTARSKAFTAWADVTGVAMAA